jgi:hypothetical protein
MNTTVTFNKFDKYGYTDNEKFAMVDLLFLNASISALICVDSLNFKIGVDHCNNKFFSPSCVLFL